MNIITDSCCDLSKSLEDSLNRFLVPFKIDIGDKSFSDDGSIDIQNLIKEMTEYKGVPKTAAPSPMDFYKGIQEGGDNFIVTISNSLSAAYSNAILAKDMFLETAKANIHVFNSNSAASGESLVALKLAELIEKGMAFDEIVKEVEAFIGGMRTLFVLDSVENLKKNGRLSKITGFLVSALSIKPVLQGVNGEIHLLEKPRGLKNAHMRLVEIIGKDEKILGERDLVIVHSNCEASARKIGDMIEDRYKPKSIHIFPAGGLSTVYADDGGIVISY